MNIESFLSLLQFSDGLFPAGAYAHSFGLEYYVQSGEVNDAAGVGDFIQASLESSAGTADVIGMLEALRCIRRPDALEALRALDQMMEAMKPVEELRNASRQMGRQMMRVAAAMTGDPLLKSYYQAIDCDSSPGHHAVSFGAVGGTLGWPQPDAAVAFLYSTASAMVGSALRLLPLGQLAGQQILWRVKPVMERLAAAAVPKTTRDIWSFAPGLEIASMRHAQLDARLFRS